MQQMLIEHGHFRFQHEQPETIKFAWPLMVLPDLFATSRHLNSLSGYLATIGWQVYVPELRDPAATEPYASVNDLVQAALDAIAALGGPMIVLGHGLGGLVALKLAESPAVKAAVALAPLLPGKPYPLVSRWQALKASWRQSEISPPSADALAMFFDGLEPYQHASMASLLVAEKFSLLADLSRPQIRPQQAQHSGPRLIVAGERDRLAPLESARAFAEQIGATFRTVAGRGHWLIGGRALERAVGEAHRFLVRELGQDLLLLYPEEWKEAGPSDAEPGRGPSSRD